MNSLQNSAQVIQSTECPAPPLTTRRTAPMVPPLPRNSPVVSSTHNSYMPYSSVQGYNGMGFAGGYNYGMPYRSSLYNYGGYNNCGMYGMGSYGGYSEDAERRFIQYAEESSRNTFANVESIVRAVNSISMMLDNTFFAMTSSFRAVLSVAENFGRLRNMFGHIWYSVNIFRLFNWLYRKLMWLIGKKVPTSPTTIAWNQAVGGAAPSGASPGVGSNWSTLAFLGVLISAPYIISKFLPKYEDKTDPANWKSPGIKAKAAFDFIARSPNELSVQTNDILTLAPPHVQNEMNLINSDWAFATCNGRSGIVPLNYLLNMEKKSAKSVPVPRNSNGTTSHKTKRVSFGENQVFENFDLDDYVSGRKSNVKKIEVVDDRKKEGSKVENLSINEENGTAKVEASENFDSETDHVC